MVPKLVLQNENPILSYCGTHMSENISKMQEKNVLLNFSFSVSCELRRMQFLLSNLYFSLYFGNCRAKRTLILCNCNDLCPIFIYHYNSSEKIKTKKQDSVALGMRFRIQTTGKCESWAATCETVSFKF